MTPPSLIELFRPVLAVVLVFLVEFMFVAPFVIVFKPSVKVS